MEPSDLIKAQILDLVNEYYQCTQKEKSPSNKIRYSGRCFDEKEIQNAVESSLEFYLTESHWTQKFEKKLASKLNVKYCHFVNSGSSANLLAFFTLTSPQLAERQIKRGDEVITTSSCFPTTLSPIIQYGAVPVFVDVDLISANIDISKLEQAVSEKTKAIMLAHTLGIPFNIEEVQNFCVKHNLWLISDECDALGSTHKGNPLSDYADISTYSFFPAHHITTGEGGAVVTNNFKLSQIMRSLKNWGRDFKCPVCVPQCENRFNQGDEDCRYQYSHMGFNLKATEIQASIGCAQLDKLDTFIKIRKENWRLLYEGLNHLQDYFIINRHENSENTSPFGFLITLKKGSRNHFSQYLESKGIETRNLFAGNILKHICFDTLKEGIDYRVAGTLDNTNNIMNNSIWIGVAPIISKENIQYMIETIKQYFSFR